MTERVTYYPPTLSVTERLRLRFARLRRDPLFPVLVERYARAWEDDDDQGCRDIEGAMLAALRVFGQPCPSGICATCGRPKPELSRDYEQECDSCRDHMLERTRQKKEADERYAKMSPEERAEARRAMRLYMGGLFARDVQ
jgi:hypothetical protein